MELKKLIFFILILCLAQAENEFDVKDAIKFIKEAVKQHNIYRQQHNVPELKLNYELVELAQDEAEKYAFDRSSATNQVTFKNENVGKNLALATGVSVYSGETVTNLWYSKGKSFRYNINDFQDAGSFTQVVWKNSKEIGLGVYKKGSSIYMVALYYPAGNVQGAIKENVLPPKNFQNENTDNIGVTSLLDELKKILSKFESNKQQSDFKFSKKLLEKLKEE